MRQKAQNRFLSSSIYEQLVPQNSIWREITELIDWEKWSKKLEVMYKNSGEGRTNWSPAMMLKILLLQRVYNSSDRKTQELCTQNIMVKYFLGLEIQQEAPDYSTVAKFKNQILKKFGASFYEEFFQEILIELKEAGLKFSGTYAVDSTITNADVNTWKDKQRQEKEGKTQRDKDASWTAKSRPSKKDKGNKTTYYYGYKMHTLVDIEKQIITAISSDTASPHDINYVQELIGKGEKIGKLERFTADAAYDDAFLIKELESKGVTTAIRVRKNRTKQVDMDNEGYWRWYMSDEKRKSLRRKRGQVERPYADLKTNHGFGRCRYLGLEKFKMQSYMSTAAYNLKIGLKLLFNAKLNVY